MWLTPVNVLELLWANHQAAERALPPALGVHQPPSRLQVQRESAQQRWWNARPHMHRIKLCLSLDPSPPRVPHNHLDPANAIGCSTITRDRRSSFLYLSVKSVHQSQQRHAPATKTRLKLTCVRHCEAPRLRSRAETRMPAAVCAQWP
jgi:hypothetical protein